MAISFSDFFTKFGKAAFAMQTANTATGTTVEDEVEDFVQEFGATQSLELHSILEGIRSSLQSFQASGVGMNQILALAAQNLLIELVYADNPQLSRTLTVALDELILQMRTAGESLDASTVSATTTYATGNVGNGKLVFSPKRGDGLVNEHIFGEDLTISSTDEGFNISFAVTGEEAQFNRLAHDWPQGSGVSTGIVSHSSDSGSNLVTNGGFEEEDDNATDLPEGWIVETGTLGTTIKLPATEVQTVIMSGTPTTGHYVLKFTDSNSDVHTTVPLVYNASQSAVQSALRDLPELGDITVATTGTSPDYTHTITFTGVKNPTQLTSTENTDSGSLAHATSTAGSADTYKGQNSLEIDSNGAQLTSIMVPVTLEPLTQYAVHFWTKCDVVPAAGVVTVDLVDGAGGTVLRDDQNMQNSLKFPAANLTTSWQSLTALLSAVNEVQTLTITGTPTGGDFTLTFDGQTTAAIAYNANSAAVQAALEALSNIGVGDVTCGGGALPGTPVTITFSGAYAARDVPLITADDAGLTGGVSPTATVAETTKGNSATAAFRTPASLPNQVYLRLWTSTAISNTTSAFFDEVVLVQPTQLYAGGPSLALFDGNTEWSSEDYISVAVANDRAGALNEWAERVYSLRDGERLIPTNNAGAETRADSLIA
jgi:hypothetical protein